MIQPAREEDDAGEDDDEAEAGRGDQQGRVEIAVPEIHHSAMSRAVHGEARPAPGLPR
jgi:hypothetical protein